MFHQSIYLGSFSGFSLGFIFIFRGFPNMYVNNLYIPSIQFTSTTYYVCEFRTPNLLFWAPRCHFRIHIHSAPVSVSAPVWEPKTSYRCWNHRLTIQPDCWHQCPVPFFSWYQLRLYTSSSHIRTPSKLLLAKRHCLVQEHNVFTHTLHFPQVLLLITAANIIQMS